MKRPPYRVPTLAEVADLPWNGLTVASLFAGGGGSSTGYRMAGYRVAYANEFVPSAAETYRANAAPHTIVDTTDVREVPGSRILAAAGGSLDVLDGSPPCASFSMAGKRHAGWGQEHAYSGRIQRTDDLFDEYTRLVGEVRPRAFVAENVTGLTRGVAHGYLRRTLAGLAAHGYRVRARTLDASWLDVPQGRQRLIIVGVREDVGLDPVHPAPLPYRRVLTDAVPSARGVWCGGFQAYSKGETGGRYLVPADSHPVSTLGASLISGSGRGPSASIAVTPDDRTAEDPETGYRLDRAPSAAVRYPRERFRYLTLAECRAVCGFPPDYVLTGTHQQRWERLGRSVPPLMMKAVAARLAAVLPALETA